MERAVSLGASIHEDHRSADGRGWVTLHDPEGNEFCIERSETELAR
ncbi:VOC family protein [Glutamicibacter halophytocola]